ncbi:MAG: hypothetical protein AAGI66_10010 [Cyanobacteria bacterium P01_H01_bin.74]
MASDIPEIIILAILGSCGTADPFEVVTKIVKRLKTVCKTETELQKYIVQLQTISKLRNLDKLFIERKEDMAIDTGISMMDVAWYREAFTSGEKRGVEKTLKEAEKARLEAQVNTAKKLLQLGKLSDEEIMLASGLSQPELNELKQQLSTH